MSFQELQLMTTGMPLPLSAVNEEGENIIIEKGENAYDKYYQTTALQKNGWCRVNVYYQNGDEEEYYEK